MNEAKPISSAAQPDGAKAIVLGYEPIAPAEALGSRPIWVYLVVGVYLFLLSVLVSLPLWAGWMEAGRDEIATLATIVAILLLCGLSLTLIPVRVIKRRRVTRRSIWFPVIVSGLLAGALVFGGGLALAEYRDGFGDFAPRVVLIAAVLTWVGWSILFAVIASSGKEQSVGMKLHRWLIAGSVMELLIAVPTHVIVRRRQECCAGVLTGLGICIGVAIMLVSFGPSVLLLYHQRRKQITPKQKTG